MPEFVISVRLK